MSVSRELEHPLFHWAKNFTLTA